MRRRGAASVAANPVLIGAATVLVIIVAVFLAYNANRGLPFVPTYSVKVEVPSAANLVPGNEVRVAGTRVGVIDTIDPEQESNGTTYAVLDLKLDTTVKPLANDTRSLVRPRSALGLKFLQLQPGSKEGSGTIPEGGTLPLKQSDPQVEIDDIFNMFDDKTRSAVQTNLRGFGDAFAGRGESINLAIEALRPFVTHLGPVARNLANPRTGLKNFFKELGDAARIVAPAAEAQASLFVNLDTTFAALASVTPSLQEFIRRSPPALASQTVSLAGVRPFLKTSTTFFAILRPGAVTLPQSAPNLADAVQKGADGVLTDSILLNERLIPALQSIQQFGNDPIVGAGLDKLTETVQVLNQPLAFIVPAQTTCNYLTLFLRNTASLLSVGNTATGTSQRFIVISGTNATNSELNVSRAPGNGGPISNHLHSNIYPNTASPGQSPRECRAGNDGYVVGKTIIGNPPGNGGLVTEGQVPPPKTK